MTDYEQWERQQYDLTEEEYKRWRSILYRSIKEWPVEFVYHVAQQVPVHNLRKLAAEWVRQNPDSTSVNDLESRVR